MSVWPPTNLSYGTAEYLEAIGVLIAATNEIEYQMANLYSLFLPVLPDDQARIFDDHNNAHRLKLIRAFANHKGDEEVISMVSEFIGAAHICISNRNIVAHSKTYLAGDGQTYAEKRRSKDQQWSKKSYSVKALRSAAIEAHETGRMGKSVALWIMSEPVIGSSKLRQMKQAKSFPLIELPLPKMPFQPKPLTPRPEADL